MLGDIMTWNDAFIDLISGTVSITCGKRNRSQHGEGYGTIIVLYKYDPYQNGSVLIFDKIECNRYSKWKCCTVKFDIGPAAYKNIYRPLYNRAKCPHAWLNDIAWISNWSIVQLPMSAHACSSLFSKADQWIYSVIVV